MNGKYVWAIIEVGSKKQYLYVGNLGMTKKQAIDYYVEMVRRMYKAYKNTDRFVRLYGDNPWRWLYQKVHIRSVKVPLPKIERN